MSWLARKILCDARDYELLRIVREVTARGRDLEYTRRQYYSHFHPRGIKEMAESRSLRIAYGMIHLLTSLEVGGMAERIAALRSLRAEVLDTAEGPMPKNTARALLQIMKEMVRAGDDERQQLMLAHDFRITASGKPRIVRRQLKRHRLLEMPEAWNQIAFDDHVHDVNTKGRKSSTHLIMDAWIKGIRRLRVVHYNYIEPRFAAELLESARIMEIDVRIGIEFFARFRDKYVRLIWVPRGFPDARAFIQFLKEPAMIRLMKMGREVSAYQQRHVMALLHAFNERHLDAINRACDTRLPPFSEAAFLDFVGIGQKSILHLEKFIHTRLLDALRQRVAAWQAEMKTADPESGEHILSRIAELDGMDLETLILERLCPEHNPDIPDPDKPANNSDAPPLPRLSPSELLDRLANLQTGYRITLTLSGLSETDVLELLYEGAGMITRLELFNLKDWAKGHTDQVHAVNRLQNAINQGNPITLKRLILDAIETLPRDGSPECESRLAALNKILHHIESFRDMYRGRNLKARLGSDSTGRSARMHGMGLAVRETLPPRARRYVRRSGDYHFATLPIHITVHRRHTFIPLADAGATQAQIRSLLAFMPLIHHQAFHKKEDWEAQTDSAVFRPGGNVITLGGARKSRTNDLTVSRPENPRDSGLSGLWAYINSNLRNCIKVAVGFIPAFATFYLTQTWWVLGWLGAFIWFGITGVRNILQSVLGGGGLRRSPLLRWNAYVSWDRIADSLLFTGFSVPLLDLVVKTLILDRFFQITTASHPIFLYTFMAVANGLYISSHNAFRGLPKTAVIANFFRSILSIPIAVVLNMGAGALLASFGVAGADQILQKWAAVISKTASDMMAGLIEGMADRSVNIRTRFRDYQKKLDELSDIYSRLELLFPETRHIDILEPPAAQREGIDTRLAELERIIAIHALDLLYFWFYQPRARSALRQMMAGISEEERHMFITAQSVLSRQKDICQMFIDGMLGPDFGRALAFYLSHAPEYLKKVQRFT